MAERLLSFDELGPKKGIRYSRDHLRRRCKAGTFPQPVPVGEHRIAWLETEIDAYIETIKAARRPTISEPLLVVAPNLQPRRRGRKHPLAAE